MDEGDRPDLIASEDLTTIEVMEFIQLLLKELLHCVGHRDTDKTAIHPLTPLTLLTPLA